MHSISEVSSVEVQRPLGVSLVKDSQASIRKGSGFYLRSESQGGRVELNGFRSSSLAGLRFNDLPAPLVMVTR